MQRREQWLKNKNLGAWLPEYFRERLAQKFSRPPEGLRHILWAVVDHYEPQHAGADMATARQRVDSWRNGYPTALERFVDADGAHPLHTWFYPPHHDLSFLEDLRELCRRGFGEIEMHLHHNHMRPFPDTERTLREKIERCIDDYAKLGIFCLPDGRRTFAFIHGDWSLANSRGPEFCGVNNELALLRDCGCYADFTFPSLGVAQPSMINRMYYAAADSRRPKSYDRGVPVRCGGSVWGDLLMVNGILGLRRRSPALFDVGIETSNLDDTELPGRDRVDYWVRHAVRIPGNDQWLFVKLHTHGAPEKNHGALFGSPAIDMYEYLTKEYNDGERYALHFVTARHMYNIIKAAEAGKQGNPGAYRDFLIPPYVYL